MEYLSNIGKKVSQYISPQKIHYNELISDTLSDTIWDPNNTSSQIKGDTFYFYLVDEYTMKPIIPDEDDDNCPYPIEITTPNKHLHKFMPLMKVGLKAMTLVNGVAAVVQSFGFPSPNIPDKIENYCNDFVGNLSVESSVAEFDVLQLSLKNMQNNSINQDEDEQNVKRYRGKALRELSEFLLQNDKHHNFCGLQRMLCQDGKTLWTTPENIEIIQTDSIKDYEWNTTSVNAIVDTRERKKLNMNAVHNDDNIHNMSKSTYASSSSGLSPIASLPNATLQPVEITSNSPRNWYRFWKCSNREIDSRHQSSYVLPDG